MLKNLDNGNAKGKNENYKDILIKFNQNIQRTLNEIHVTKSINPKLFESISKDAFYILYQENPQCFYSLNEVLELIFEEQISPKLTKNCENIYIQTKPENYSKIEQDFNVKGIKLQEQFETEGKGLYNKFIKISEDMIGLKLPEILLKPYSDLILDKIRSIFYILNSKKQRVKLNANINWGKSFQKYLQLIYSKKLKLFDPKIIGTNFDKIIIEVLRMIQYTYSSFPNASFYLFKATIFDLLERSNISKTQQKELENEFSKILNDNSQKNNLKINFLNSVNKLFEYASALIIDYQMYLIFCILLFISNSYFKGNIKCSVYLSINRVISRKILMKLSNHKENKNNFYNVHILSIFENELGLFLNSHKDNIQQHFNYLNHDEFLFLIRRGETEKKYDLINFYKKIIEKWPIDQLILRLNKNNPNISKNGIELLDFVKYFKQSKIDGKTHCILERISQNSTSKNCFICLSGFLNEETDEKKSWKDIVKIFPEFQMFALKYSSSSLEKVIKKNLWGFLFNYKDFIADHSKALLEGTNAEKTQTFQEFIRATKNAKIVGKLLAICIALHYAVSFESINLIGFSLGTQVIATCIKYLYRLNINYRINDVIFFGGAVSISAKIDKYKEYFKIVNGKIFNFHSKYDLVLSTLESFTKKKTIGKHRLFFSPKSSVKEGKTKNCKNVKNIQTEIGHLIYRQNMEANIIKNLKKYYFP